ncbi:MAG: phage holin family protein [Bacteroidia bacterium]
MNFKNWIIKVSLTGLAILSATYLLPGVEIDDYRLAWVVAILLSILNALVRPLLVFLTFPITIFTLGFFLLVINGAIILMVDEILDGFQVRSLAWAIFLSILVSLFTYILEQINQSGKKDDER